eukprot:8356975-Pyramimonas_sp.AAC.1
MPLRAIEKKRSRQLPGPNGPWWLQSRRFPLAVRPLRVTGKKTYQAAPRFSSGRNASYGTENETDRASCLLRATLQGLREKRFPLAVTSLRATGYTKNTGRP